MAWTMSTISAGEKSAANADKPIMVADNVCNIPVAAPNWYGWTGSRNYAIVGTDTATNNTAMPATRAYDAHHHLLTSPTKLGTSQKYALVWNLSTTSLIDCVGLLGVNFGDVHGGTNTTVSIWVADDSAFSTNRRNVAAWVISNG